MIGDVLARKLTERFPDRGLRIGASREPVARFPAVHPDVGDVVIWDDGDEATIEIGTITHGHFNPYDQSLTAEQVAERVATDVIEFLEELFADRVLVWASPDRRSGGWVVLNTETTESLMDEEDQAYVWTGPWRNPLRDQPG